MESTGDRGAPVPFGRAPDGTPFDAKRVAALRAALAAGTYRVDPAAIAGRLLEVEGLLLGRALARG